MKKYILALALTLSFIGTSNANQLVVIDDNGYVVKQIYTAPTTYTTTPTTSTAPLTVVRQSPTISNSYY